MYMEVCQCLWESLLSLKACQPPGSRSIPLKNENPCKCYVLGSRTKALEVLTTPESLLMLLKVSQCLLKPTNVPGSPLLPWKSANVTESQLLPWKSANIPGSPQLP